MNELYHYGVKGMKWGIRRFQNKNGTLTNEGKKRYAVESSKTIKTNADGSKTVPRGFMFNRVGKNSLDINKSGGLYVSYGKTDAARYVKTLGPTLMGKLFGNYGEAVQHISVKEPLKMPSDKQLAAETAKLLMSDKKLLDSFNRSIYSSLATGDIERDLTTSDLKSALKDPSGKSGQKLSYGVSSFLGNANYAHDAKRVYNHFIDKGYDALPDSYDRLNGVSETAMIIINPKKVQITSTTRITKDVMKDAKRYVHKLEKLKISDIVK